jgi:hypothetical protein
MLIANEDEAAYAESRYSSIGMSPHLLQVPRTVDVVRLVCTCKQPVLTLRSLLSAHWYTSAHMLLAVPLVQEVDDDLVGAARPGDVITVFGLVKVLSTGATAMGAYSQHQIKTCATLCNTSR